MYILTEAASIAVMPITRLSSDIKRHQFAASMSAKGNCFDNAPIESFWGVLKNKLIYHQDYKTRFAAIIDIIRYIELYYNQTRIQKGLGYRSPRQVWFDYYRQAA